MLLAVESEGVGGHLLHRRRPALVGSGLRASGARERLQAGRDHDLQVPLGEHRVGILPVENFALLGDANLAGKIADRLGENGGVSGAAAASDGAAAAVKEAQLHVALARGAMQVAMGLVQLPDAGQHAAVFVGIGIAQHDFLPASPGIEQRLIVRRRARCVP